MSAFPLRNMITSLGLFPESVRNRLIANDIAWRIPFIDGAGFIYQEIKPDRIVIRLPNNANMKNQTRIHNAYRAAHPIAIALLAETAAGFFLGMNQAPDDKYELHALDAIYFYSPDATAGDLIATVAPDESIRQQIKTNESGLINLDVSIWAEKRGDMVCECQTTWAC